MRKKDIKLIQRFLKDQTLYTGIVDGKRGTKTDTAVQLALDDSSERLPDEWADWSSRRKAIACLQLVCIRNNIDAGPIDGLYGPQTETAADQLSVFTATGTLPRGFGDIIPIRANPHSFPVETESEMTAFYGQPGEVPLVKVTCPWTLRLDWDLSTTTQTISIHETLGDSLSRILDQLFDIYGETGIRQYRLDRYGGSYNPRKKRGSLHSWSTHAWGIAIDWFPSRNKMHWDHEHASLADPALDKWWETWENEGWLNLGRSENRDWMHVQAAKR